MKKKSSSENRFMKIIKMPFRALAKARDFYVRSMNNLADTGNYDGLGWGGPVYVDPPMPRSLSTSAMRTTQSDRDLTELVRAASTGALGNRILMMNTLHTSATTTLITSNNLGVVNNNNNNKVTSSCSNRVPRCGSVVMAKIIEEDEPSNNDHVATFDNGVRMTNSKIGEVNETRKIHFVL